MQRHPRAQNSEAHCQAQPSPASQLQQPRAPPPPASTPAELAAASSPPPDSTSSSPSAPAASLALDSWTPLLHRALSLLLLLSLLCQPLWLRAWAWQRLRGLALALALALPPPWGADLDLALVVGGSALVHACAYAAANLCVAAAYWRQPRWLQPFRVRPQQPWPWQLRGAARDDYARLLRRSLPLVAANLLLVAPALLGLAAPLQRWAGLQLQCGADAMPTWRESAAQLAVMVVVEDTIFYWSHRLLHTPLFYPIHRTHHEYRHPIGVASEYAHPLEFVLKFLFSNALPLTLGPLLFGRLHCWTLWQWLLLRVSKSVEEHCGFDLPFSPFRSLPLGAGAAAHLRHHEQPDANFASLLAVWDWLCATDDASRQRQRRRYSREKRDGSQLQQLQRPH